MILDTVVVGPLGVNCYIIGCGNIKEGIVVDPGANAERILAKVRDLGLTIKYIVNTHGHFDHVGGNADMVGATGAKLLIHPEDAPLLGRAQETAALYGVVTRNSPPPDMALQDGLVITFGELSAKVLHTPGHTRGGCCLAVDGAAFTGDTLFAASIGRTDLPGGSEETLHASIRQKLYTLPETTVEIGRAHV